MWLKLKTKCTECIRESVNVRDIDMRASYDQKSVGFQTEYQSMAAQGKNLSKSYILI